jgi:hypothetical protein
MEDAKYWQQLTERERARFPQPCERSQQAIAHLHPGRLGPALGPIQLSNQWVKWIISPVAKQLGAWSWPLTLFSARVSAALAYPPLRLHGVDRYNKGITFVSRMNEDCERTSSIVTEIDVVPKRSLICSIAPRQIKQGWVLVCIIAQKVQRLAMDWTVRGSNPGGGEFSVLTGAGALLWQWWGTGSPSRM